MKIMRKTFYYCCDLEEQEEMLRQCMKELSGHISLPPIEISYQFTELPRELEKDVREIFYQSDDVVCCEGKLCQLFLERHGDLSSLLVICPKTSRLAKAYLKKYPWGIANISLAIVYGLYDKYVIWHEMLHLLGAKDCYDLSKSDRGPNCECPNCIMQYEATRANVRNWPFLCDANIQRMQKRIREWKKQS